MKLTYTGRQVELAPAQLKKIESRFTKIGKLLDGKDEREAHVVLSTERHLHHAEITVNFHSHQLVGVGSDGDLFTAINAAADKLEKQAIKSREKWRDSKRGPKQAGEAAAAEGPAPGDVRADFAGGDEEPATGISRQSRPEPKADDSGRSAARNGERPGLPRLPRRGFGSPGGADPAPRRQLRPGGSLKLQYLVNVPKGDRPAL